MSLFLKAICQNLSSYNNSQSSYKFPELEFQIEKQKNFQIIDERNYHYDVEFYEINNDQKNNSIKKDLNGKVVKIPEGEWEIQVKFLNQSHGIMISFIIKKCGIYINESAQAFTKQLQMHIHINSSQFKHYNEQLFNLGNSLKITKIREHWIETHKDREIKLDLTQFTQNNLQIDTKQLWQKDIDNTPESYYSRQQPIERKYPKRIIVKQQIINEKKITVDEIAEIVNDMKVQEEKNKKQQEIIRQQRMKEREEKRKKEEAELAQKGNQIQELAKFYKEQKISDKLYSLTASALLPLQSSTPAPKAQKQQQQSIQYYYQNPSSLEYIYGGRGSEFLMQEFESSLAWGNESFGYKGIIQKQLKEIKEKEKKRKVKGIRPIAQEAKDKHSIRPIKKIKIQ